MNRYMNYDQAYDIFSLIKNYVDDHTPDDVVYSVSLNGGNVIRPDAGGNVDLTIPTPVLTDYVKKTDKVWLRNLYGKENWSFEQLIYDTQSDPIVTQSYVDAKVPDLTNIIKTVSVNNGTRVGPDNTGNADLQIQTYTLELDGGSESNITASIDNGDPVSKDSNDNINLNVPDKYISTFYGWGRQFDNTNNPLYDEDGNPIPHTINLGFIGKPRYYVEINSNPAFIQDNDPKFFYIDCPNDGIIELHGLDNQYIKIAKGVVIDIKGNVWIFKADFGNYAHGFFIGTPKSLTMDILSLGSYSRIKVCTAIDQFEEFNLKTWERTIVAKGWNRTEILNLIDTQASSITWIYKPTVNKPDLIDKNTIYPNMIYEVGDSTVQEDFGMKFIYINFPDNANLNAGQWVFRNKYVGSMEGSDYVYRMPYYDMNIPDGSWILMDFVLGNSTKTRDNRDYHCTITDWNLNPLIDVTIHNFAGTTMDYTVEQHIYYRLRYHKEKKFWEVYRGVDF